MADDERKPEESKTDSTVSTQFDDQYSADLDDNRDWLNRAKESFRFYTGIQQWDEDVLDLLNEEGRPALTLNHVFPIINLLAGYQRQNRQDIRLFPRRNGTAAIAGIGSELIKHTMDMSDGKYESSDAFVDGLVGGKGFISVNREFLMDPLNGDLVVQKESPFSILPDQGNRHYSMDKGNHYYKSFWWTKSEVELAYPKKVKDIQQIFSSPDNSFERYSPGVEDYEDDYGVFEEDEDRRTRTRYFIRERYMKVYENVTFIVHKETLTPYRLEKDKIEKAQAIISNNILQDEFQIVERVSPIMYYTAKMGELVLEHTRDPLNGIHLFPMFRFCPYWVDGYVMGVVDNLKDPQRQLNKTKSQVLHHLNATAHSGYIHDHPTDDDELRKLDKMGAKPGIHLDRSKFSGFLEQIKAQPLDTGHFIFSQDQAANMKEISGANSDLLGTNTNANESGRARIVRQQAGLTVSETIFDNHGRTQKALGTFLWEVIRRTDVYSDEEIKSVAQEANLKHFVNEETGELDMTPIKNWNLGLYGVKVSQSANLPTIRMANFEQILEAMKAGVQIPPHFLAELSEWPNKDEIVAFLRQMAGIPIEGKKGGGGQRKVAGQAQKVLAGAGGV